MEDNRSPAEKLAALPFEEQEKFLNSLTDEQRESLLYDWRGFHARPKQIAPDTDWDIWMALAGRGFGKTRSGAEWVREMCTGDSPIRMAIISETQKDLEEVMVEGVSGILSCCHPDEMPTYLKKPVKLKWPNGSLVLGYTATTPEVLRGPQFHAAWCDELAKWRYARETWEQLQFGLRLGDHPKVFITTTPRPIQLMKDLIAGTEGKIEIVKGSTLDNRSNLSPKYLKSVLKKYSGTRLGRQELDAEMLGDMPGALWTQGQIDTYRVNLEEKVPEMSRTVVAVDIAVSNTENSDEHGIMVCGVHGGTGYLIEDGSLKGSPVEWARRAIGLMDKHGAYGIVVETNQGGDLIRQTLESVRPGVCVIEVRASKGKHVRAAPIASLAEQGRIRHIGNFPSLEEQLTLMTQEGYQGSDSPDRLDAYVWGFTQLFPEMLKEPSKGRLAYRRHSVARN